MNKISELNNPVETSLVYDKKNSNNYMKIFVYTDLDKEYSQSFHSQATTTLDDLLSQLSMNVTLYGNGNTRAGSILI